MVGYRFLLIVGLTAVVALAVSNPGVASAVTHDSSACSLVELQNGACGVKTNDGGVQLGVHERTPTPGTPGSPAPRPRHGQFSGIGNTDDPNDSCNALRPCDIHVINPHKPGIGGIVTIADLKNFAPHPGIDHMQPNGWAVIGLDTNFYSTVGSELEHNQLLGKTADVQFTPVSWHWTYGDGRSATLATPGASWAATGSQDFDPTSTSHIFLKKGSYTIQLDITFSAQYRYAGGSWTDVIGTIELPANPLRITAGEARTVLVNHDCRQNPSGPGC